jgi:hypothetical protein
MPLCSRWPTGPFPADCADCFSPVRLTHSAICSDGGWRPKPSPRPLAASRSAWRGCRHVSCPEPVRRPLDHPGGFCKRPLSGIHHLRDRHQAFGDNPDIAAVEQSRTSGPATWRSWRPGWFTPDQISASELWGVLWVRVAGRPLSLSRGNLKRTLQRNTFRRFQVAVMSRAEYIRRVRAGLIDANGVGEVPTYYSMEDSGGPHPNNAPDSDRRAWMSLEVLLMSMETKSGLASFWHFECPGCGFSRPYDLSV